MKARMPAILALPILLTAARSDASERSWRCAEPIRAVEACRRVHGRLQATNGSPSFRIWVVGTKRILGVAGDEGHELLPPGLRQEVGLERIIYGDFEVCPVTPMRPGEMQRVCVNSGQRLVQELTAGGKQQFRKLPDAPPSTD
jgi:hypothetical protein